MVEEPPAAPLPMLPLQAAAYTCSNYRGRRRLLAPSANVIPPSLGLIHSRGPQRSGCWAGLRCEHGGVKPLRLWVQGQGARAALRAAPELRSSLAQDCLCGKESLAILPPLCLIYDRLDYCRLQANLHFILKLFLCVEDRFAMNMNSSAFEEVFA